MSYRHQLAIQYLADFPGARVEQNQIAVTLENSDIALPVKLVEDTTETTDSKETTDSPTDDVEGASFTQATYPSPIGQEYAVHLDVTATRPDALHGLVESTGAYDVWVMQGHRDHAEPLVVNQVANGKAGGATTSLERTAHGDSLGVVVVDASGNPADQEVTGTIHVT